MTTATYDHSDFTRVVICFVLIAFTAGCTTMRSLPTNVAQSLARQIEVGDKIKIIRNDYTDVTFKVSASSDEGISGDEVFVAYSDIRQVQVSQPSNAKSALKTGLIVVGIVVVVTAMFLYEQGITL